MSAIAIDVEEDLEELPLLDINLAEKIIIHKNSKLWKLPLSSLADLVATPIPRGHIDGLICSNSPGDTEHDITVAPGQADDSTHDIVLELLESVTKRIDAEFDVGTGAGGLFAGASLGANTPYYPFLIRDGSSGDIDVGFDDNVLGSHCPAAFTSKRRIMSLHTDASANIRGFKQTGDYIELTTSIQERAEAALADTNRNAFATNIPPLMIGRFNAIAYYGTTAANHYLWVGSSSRVDAVASPTNYDFHVYLNSGIQTASLNIKTDSSKNIFARGTSTNIFFGFFSLGWIDHRGKDQ